MNTGGDMSERMNHANHKNDDADLEQWVDQKMGSLDQGNDPNADLDHALGRFRERTATRHRRRGFGLAAIVGAAACLVVLALPWQVLWERAFPGQTKTSAEAGEVVVVEQVGEQAEQNEGEASELKCVIQVFRLGAFTCTQWSTGPGVDGSTVLGVALGGSGLGPETAEQAEPSEDGQSVLGGVLGQGQVLGGVLGRGRVVPVAGGAAEQEEGAEESPETEESPAEADPETHVPLEASEESAPAPVVSRRAGGAAGEVLRIGAGVSPPAVISQVQPEYSAEARAAGYEGVVVLEAIIHSDGSFEIVRVVRSLGLGLDE
jgi:hypothetical protein